MVTAKEAFRLADSIMRYECCRYDGEGYLPDKFDYDRGVIAEVDTVPDAILGAAYKWQLKIDTNSEYELLQRGRPSRIIEIYNEKLKDRDYRARGSYIQYPDGYGVVGGRMVLKRISVDKIRMT